MEKESNIKLSNSGMNAALSETELPSLTDSCDADESEVCEISRQSSVGSLITAGDLDTRLAECAQLLSQSGTDIFNVKATTELDYIAQTLRNNSTDANKRKDISTILARNHFHIVFNKVLVHLDNHDVGDLGTGWKVIRKYLTQFWIVSDASKQFCEKACNHDNTPQMIVSLLGKLSEHITAINMQDNVRYLSKSLLGIVHNINRHHYEAKDTFHDLDLLRVLKGIANSNIPMIRAKCVLVMSYIVKETEIAMLNADTQLMEFIAQDVLQDAYRSPDHVSRRFGMSVEETLRGLFNLAASDQNKALLLQLGVLPIYVELIMRYAKTEEVFQAAMSIWRLAFQPQNKTAIRSVPHCTEALLSLQSSSDEMVKHAARGALWELREQANLTVDTGLANREINCPHIMISYQWDSQPLMLKVKDKLRAAGFKVWMDVEHMTGSTLEAMALAVERSAVVLLCMSQRFKDSPSCRSEAEYTYKLRKDFIPLRLQMNYVPDGWLGMLIGTRLFFDFSTEELVDQQFPNLIKELGSRGKIGAGVDDIDGTVPLSTPGYNAKVTRPMIPACADWSLSQVCQWVTSLDLSLVPIELSSLDGKLLAELKAVMDTSPETFYHCLRTDLHLPFLDVLKLSRAIRLI